MSKSPVKPRGDVFSTEKRSWVMSRIRGVTAIEKQFRRGCWQAGLRGWRLQRRVCGVRVDLLFSRARVVVFVDGCFWHGCARCYQAPRQNAAFWRSKLESNRRRDMFQTRMLRRNGWKVLRLWECDVENRMNRCLEKLMTMIATNPTYSGAGSGVQNLAATRTSHRKGAYHA